MGHDRSCWRGRVLDALEEGAQQQDHEGGDSGIQRQSAGGEAGDRARQDAREEDERREYRQQGGDHFAMFVLQLERYCQDVR